MKDSKHWELYHQFEQIALEIDNAPLTGKMGAAEKMLDLVCSTLVTHEQRINANESQIDDLQTVVMVLSKAVYGVPVEVEGEGDGVA